ncbi:hypothetical protein Glove_123g103 [Diversispora epigaea]|uniref:Uncharacterized protein n=1 Tax=Diversispora epigaea TaxID=1348612 RepID=A0A397IYJ2_9GLOM|nr:hypothetical protein Glove_123g103 [Diversispora epigaea]
MVTRNYEPNPSNKLIEWLDYWGSINRMEAVEYDKLIKWINGFREYLSNAKQHLPMEEQIKLQEFDQLSLSTAEQQATEYQNNFNLSLSGEQYLNKQKDQYALSGWLNSLKMSFAALYKFHSEEQSIKPIFFSAGQKVAELQSKVSSLLIKEQENNDVITAISAQLAEWLKCFVDECQ